MLDKISTYFHYDYMTNEHKAAIVHIGVGSFHRAHQAVYIDDLLGQNLDKNWGIIGVNLRPQDSVLVEKINQRHGQYLLKSVSSQGDVDWREIHALQHIIDAPTNPDEAIDIVKNPDIKLITMTVTESGYYTDDHHHLDLNHPLISEEISNDNKALGSIFSYLRFALKQRMNAGDFPITILCCDNLRHNGNILKGCLYAYLKAANEQDLCDWLDKNARFPCCVVDRITPYPPNELSNEAEKLFSIHDDATIIAEDFVQWVIEDNFAGAKPALHHVGVKFADDVTPYEDTKIRILNGGHTGLVYLGALKNYQYFHDVMFDARLAQFFDEYQLHEAIPALKYDFAQQNYHEDPDCSLHQYYEIIKSRFSNSNIADTIARITADGASKFPIFILPTTLCTLKNGNDASASATIIASWYLFLQQYHHQQIPFAYNDHKWHDLAKTLVKNDDINLDAFLNEQQLWQQIPKQYPEFLSLIEAQIHHVRNMIER